MLDGGKAIYALIWLEAHHELFLCERRSRRICEPSSRTETILKPMRMHGTKPRTWETFEPKWLELMQDETAMMRVILADRVMVGAINVLMMDGEVSLGYWLGRQFWGQGIASAAVGLMLTEVTTRPLHASAAGHNLASIRVLLKHGFVETSRRWTGETERTIARETVTFVLQ